MWTAGRNFDVAAFEHAVRLWTIVLEISVLMAQFPSKEIAQLSYDYRTLGLGFANIGGLLMAAGISYDSREGRAIAGAISAVMTGVSYATSSEMAGELGPFPEYAANKDAMLRVVRNHRRAAHGETKGYEGLATLPVPLDLTAHQAITTLADAAKRAWDDALSLGEGLRLPQCAGDRHRAHRHHRPRDGLRHDRRRTRLRAGEVQEAGGRRLFQDHQPLRARSAGQPRLRPEPRSTTSSPMRSATARWKSFDGRPHPRRAARQGLRRRRRSARSKRRWNRPSTSASSSTNGHWAKRSAREMLKLDAATLDAPDFDMLKTLGFSKADIDAANLHVCGAMTLEGAPHLKDEHLAGVRLRQSLRPHRQAGAVRREPYPHDGGGAALHLGRHLQDHQHAQQRQREGMRRGLYAVLEAGAEGQCALSRRLQAVAAAVQPDLRASTTTRTSWKKRSPRRRPRARPWSPNASWRR